jgi:hypothetical protein
MEHWLRKSQGDNGVLKRKATDLEHELCRKSDEIHWSLLIERALTLCVIISYAVGGAHLMAADMSAESIIARKAEPFLPGDTAIC